MKTKVLILLFIFFGIYSCNSQEIKSGKRTMGENKPHVESKMNRKYDEHGNLIEFDSTYTSYYSTYKGDTLQADSILRNFKMYFNHHFSGIRSDNYFDMDSTFHQEFFSDDFFEKQFFRQDKLMLRMMREMDSIKNEFFRVHSQDIKSL